MRTRLATVALAGALGLTGAAGAALLGPAASYAATGDSTALSERVSSIADALSGLVSDGTITQEQADRVAETLAEARPEGLRGHGGHGGHGGPGRGADLAAAAEALGVTEQELRTSLSEGSTLADVAEEQGVEQDVLVDALVASARERLAQAVTDGRLTQEEADARAADLEERITASLDDVRGPGRGHRGSTGETPSGTPSPSSTAPTGTASSSA